MVNVRNFHPRPGLAVIPDGWAAFHQPTVDGTHTAVVEYWTGPADGEESMVWDPATHTEVPNRGARVPDRPIPARIQQILTERATTAGAQPLVSRQYRITTNEAIPDVLTTGGCVRVLDGDPYLDGRWLSVTDVQGGSLRFERVLVCLDNQN